MIHVSSHFHRSGGWGSLARGFAHALDRRETVTAHSWDVGIRADKVDDRSIGIGLGPWQNMPHTVGRRRVAAVCGETTRVPADLLRYADGAEQIWVPTPDGRQALERSGVAADRIREVPYGVDTELYRPGLSGNEARGDAPGDRPFRFLCVGKWERRKGTEDLVRAYVRAFDAHAPVELVLHCHNPYRPDLDLGREVERLRQEEGGGPPIELSEPRDEAGMVRLYQHADAFVLPSRGEGWGLPILEAMACGLPVIVTDHGGHRLFTAPDPSDGSEVGYRVPVREMRPVDDPLFFPPEMDWGHWAEPDADALVEILRRVVADPEEARRRGDRARRRALLWTWDRAAEAAHGEIIALRT